MTPAQFQEVINKILVILQFAIDADEGATVRNIILSGLKSYTEPKTTARAICKQFSGSAKAQKEIVTLIKPILEKIKNGELVVEELERSEDSNISTFLPSRTVTEEQVKILFLAIQQEPDENQTSQVSALIDYHLADNPESPEQCVREISNLLLIETDELNDKIKPVLVGIWKGDTEETLAEQNSGRSEITLSVHTQITMDELIDDIRANQEKFEFHSKEAGKFRNLVKQGQDQLLSLNEAILHPTEGLPLFNQDDEQDGDEGSDENQD